MPDAPHPTTMADLFDHEPNQPAPRGVWWSPPRHWGNRGDPWLWRSLREHFAGRPLPATTAELNAALATAFQALTGQPLDTADAFFVPQLAHGGMTSGYVLPKWWRELGFPFVRERWRAAFD